MRAAPSSSNRRPSRRDSLFDHLARLLALSTLGVILITTPPAPGAPDPTLPGFQFASAGSLEGWAGRHDISHWQTSDEGLVLSITGSDPYFSGPPRDYPAGTPLWALVRLKTSTAGPMEIFYFKDQPRAGESVNGFVPADRWVDLRLPMPALGPGFRLRLDPPGGPGSTTIVARVQFEKRIGLPAPVWPVWRSPAPATLPALRAGSLELRRSTESPLGLECRVDGQSMGFTHPHPRLGWLNGNQLEWVELSGGQIAVDRPEATNDFRLRATATDSLGAIWQFEQSFRPHSNGTIEVTTRLSASQERQIAFAPMLLLLAGEGSFGSRKQQGLLAGLEYLDDEPSSSEADIVGPESDRRVPARHKLTFPLAAILANNRYLGVAWEDPSRFAALFDSPDRTFASRGHLLGVIFPGSDTGSRDEGNLQPYAPTTIAARQTVESRCWILGGTGPDITAAVQHYVRTRGWPAPPSAPLSAQEYLRQAATGWKNVRAAGSPLYRHAVWPGFNPQPAADAAAWQSWIAAQIPGSDLARELAKAVTDGIAVVPLNSRYSSGVGHIKPPAAPLLFQSPLAAAREAQAIGTRLLQRFSPAGSIHYRAPAKGTDYSRTHWTNEANGLTAEVVATILECALFSGDPQLRQDGLARLRDLDKFRHSVPRGAQTWEVPLHTPDILATAHLTRAWTLGFQLTGDDFHLTRAREWAWTGVPFVYLTNPTGQPVGPYATIAVLGATSWKAPVWFGRPVQWCGLVYAEALSGLARVDPSGPWRQLATGITASALQQCWPAAEPNTGGLLPDFYELIPQISSGPAINPGTLASAASRYYDLPPFYDRALIRSNQVSIHAPGRIQVATDTPTLTRVEIDGWPPHDYFPLINGAPPQTVVELNGVVLSPQRDSALPALTLPAKGRSVITLRWPATPPVHP